MKKNLSAKREALIDAQSEYIDKFYTAEDVPPKPDTLSLVDYQIMCRLYLIANEHVDGAKIKIYVGDILGDPAEMKTAATRVINRLRQVADIPCLFTQKALLSWIQYDITFCVGYNPQKEYVSPNTCVVHKRSFTDFRQKRFF